MTHIDLGTVVTWCCVAGISQRVCDNGPGEGGLIVVESARENVGPLQSAGGSWSNRRWQSHKNTFCRVISDPDHSKGL